MSAFQHTPGPWARYGKFVSDALEPVGGWYLIRRVLAPAEGPRLPMYGDAFAFVETDADARTDREREARAVWVRGIESEITAEVAFLGLPPEEAAPEMSDDELMRELSQ